MEWTEELQQLTTRVYDTLGKAALVAAIGRALCEAMRQEPPVHPDSLAAELLPADAFTNGTFVLPTRAFKEALKVELQHLLTRH